MCQGVKLRVICEWVGLKDGLYIVHHMASCDFGHGSIEFLFLGKWIMIVAPGFHGEHTLAL